MRQPAYGWCLVVLFAYAGLGYASPGFAGELPPRFSHLPSATENSALNMECDGAAPFDAITCHFTQVLVRTPSADEAKEAHDAFKEATQKELQSLRSEICRGVTDARPDTSLGEGKAAAREHYLTAAKRLCNCGDGECVRSLLPSLLTDLRTCRVWANTFVADFRRVPGERKWISKAEPEGACNVVTVIVLEDVSGDGTKGILWKYTQTRVAVDSSSPLCKGFELNTPLVNSWNAPKVSLLHCDAIEFGF